MKKQKLKRHQKWRNRQKKWRNRQKKWLQEMICSQIKWKRLVWNTHMVPQVKVTERL